jgi:hypothetical protein
MDPSRRSQGRRVLGVTTWLTMAVLSIAAGSARALVYDVTADPYGAACNGTTNDIAAIDDAIQDAGNDGGGIVLIPRGVCRLAPISGLQTFDVPNGVQILGEGMASVLEAAHGGHQVFSIVGRRDVILRDFFIREAGSDYNGVGSAISITGGSSRILIENVRTKGFAHGLYANDDIPPFTSQVDELVLRDVWVERAREVGILLGYAVNTRMFNVRSTANGNDGLKFLAGSRYWEIHGGHFWDNGGAGINLVSGGNKWLIMGSRTDANALGGILVKTSSVQTPVDSPVMEGTIVDVISDGNTNGSPGLDFNAQAAAGDPFPHHITVHGGVFARNDGAGIRIRSGRNISLIGVVAKENGEQGIAINRDGFDINVIGAQISANGQAGASAGILVQGDRVRILGGTLNGKNDDVAVGDPGGASSHTTNIQVAAFDADDILIDGVTLRNAIGAEIGNPERAIIKNTLGYATQKTGTATLVNGSSSVTVLHGLARAPSLAQIALTPLSDWGSARRFWISNPTPTHFTIRVDQNPGRNVDFSWHADLTGH